MMMDTLGSWFINLSLHSIHIPASLFYFLQLKEMLTHDTSSTCKRVLSFYSIDLYTKYRHRFWSFSLRPYPPHLWSFVCLPFLCSIPLLLNSFYLFESPEIYAILSAQIFFCILHLITSTICAKWRPNETDQSAGQILLCLLTILK